MGVMWSYFIAHIYESKNKLKTNKWGEFKHGKLKFILVQLKSWSHKWDKVMNKSIYHCVTYDKAWRTSYAHSLTPLTYFPRQHQLHLFLLFLLYYQGKSRCSRYWVKHAWLGLSPFALYHLQTLNDKDLMLQMSFVWFYLPWSCSLIHFWQLVIAH